MVCLIGYTIGEGNQKQQKLPGKEAKGEARRGQGKQKHILMKKEKLKNEEKNGKGGN